MATRKSYQVLMRPKFQERLKQRSKEMGIPIGLMIENLLSSLEFRLEKYAAALERKVYELSPEHIFALTHAIWLDDSMAR